MGNIYIYIYIQNQGHIYCEISLIVCVPEVLPQSQVMETGIKFLENEPFLVQFWTKFLYYTKRYDHTTVVLYSQKWVYWYKISTVYSKDRWISLEIHNYYPLALSQNPFYQVWKKSVKESMHYYKNVSKWDKTHP